MTELLQVGCYIRYNRFRGDDVRCLWAKVWPNGNVWWATNLFDPDNVAEGDISWEVLLNNPISVTRTIYPPSDDEPDDLLRDRAFYTLVGNPDP